VSNFGPNAGIIGWREWVGLPELGEFRIKAKIDTGARTSAIHATGIEILIENGREMARFILFPNQDDDTLSCACQAPVVDKRTITDSGGHEEERLIVSTTIALGEHRWPIELSLTDRDTMGFRMLLGRAAIRKRFLIDPGASYLEGRPVIDFAAGEQSRPNIEGSH